MPLTPAEKMKRYRDKLKKDPDRYEKYKKKDLQRMKIKNKKISQITEEEKEEQRKKWKVQKRNQKLKRMKIMKTKAETENTKTDSPSSRNDKPTKENNSKKYFLLTRTLRRSSQSLAAKNFALQKKVDTLRKKLYRLKKKYSKEIEEWKNEVIKMKAREEVLGCTIRNTYKSLKNQREKRILKTIANTDVLRRTKSKTYVANLFGLSRIRMITRQKQYNAEIREKIQNFFLRDDISRITSGKKECKTYKKEKQQIRYLTDTLQNLYNIFKKEGGKYSFVTFYRYKPFYVLSPNIQNRNSCLCIKHSNMNLLFIAMAKNKLFSNEIKTVTDVLEKLSCNINSYDCIYGHCSSCKQLTLTFELENEVLNKIVKWEQWERVNHTYDKMEEGEVKQKTTKKTIKLQKQGTITDLIQNFQDKITAFKIHVFNWKHQQLKYREKIAGLKPTEVLLLCDFSENYDCKSHEEVQSTHFVKSQITLHCGMLYWAEKSQSFCSISDNKCHEPSAIWAHLMPVIELIKTTTPQVKIIHFFSDGPTTQYRQKKNFYLLNVLTTELEFEFCTWNFSESGHGKGVADGIGGAVKRSLDKQVAYGQDVTDGIKAFEILKSIPKSNIQYFCIQDSDIDRIAQKIPRDLKAITGTLLIHQVICHAHSSQIRHRVLSCFCRLNQDEVCDCYSLKKQTVSNLIIKSNRYSISKPNKTIDCNLDINVTKSVVQPTEPTSAMCYAVERNFSALTLTNDCAKTSSDLSQASVSIVDLPSAVADCLKTSTSSDLSPASASMIDLASLDIITDCAKTSTSPDFSIADLFSTDIVSDYNKTSNSSDLTPANFPTVTDAYEHTVSSSKDYGMASISSALTFATTSIIPETIDLTNHSIMTRKMSTKYFEPQKMSKLHFAAKGKENVSRNTNSSIRTVVSRCLTCYLCKEKVLFNSKDIVRCMACSKRYCITCTEGYCNFDYICRECFGED